MTTEEILKLISAGRYGIVENYIKEKGNILDLDALFYLFRKALECARSDDRCISLSFRLFKTLVERGGAGRIGEFLGITKIGSFFSFSFPVASDQNGGIVTGVGFEIDTVKGISLNLDVQGLDEVAAFTGKGFVVVFDSPFIGKSYQASLAYVLLHGKLPDNVFLTGCLEGNGFKTTERVDVKRKIAEENGKHLVSVCSDFKVLGKMLEDDPVFIPFVVTRGNGEDEIEKLFNSVAEENGLDYTLDDLLSVFNLKTENLYYQLPARIPVPETENVWEKAVREIVSRMRQISIKKRIVFAFAFNAPAALMFSVGIYIGKLFPFQVYHYKLEEDKYFLKMRSSRKLKERVKHYNFTYKICSDSEKKVCEGDPIFLGLEVASHETNIHTLAGSNPWCRIEARNKGNIDSLDWEMLNAEVYSHINDIYRHYSPSEIHIAMSVPVVIAFTLGVSLGNYWDFVVYNYFREAGGLKKVVKSTELFTEP